MPESTPSFFARFSLALRTFLRLLQDERYAVRVTQLTLQEPALLAATEPMTSAPAGARSPAEAPSAQPGSMAPSSFPAAPAAPAVHAPSSFPARQAARANEHQPRDPGPALQLLALMQREGRLVDFIQQDILGFADADVGAAARVVHQGCRRALQQALTLESIRSEPEGTNVVLEAGFDPKPYRLMGNVQGQPPFRGILRHRGWRAKTVTLEEPLASADLAIIAPAEVEL